MKTKHLIQELNAQAGYLNCVLAELHEMGKRPADLPEIIREAERRTPNFYTAPDLLEYNGCKVTVKEYAIKKDDPKRAPGIKREPIMLTRIL